ncbi:hypothetical protein SAMN04487931_10923 [Desulfobacula phenolica]|uniref:Uncharacterized protein n=2 Tax=Desulfobacula phenolica TaxID=90732 RepID=A0A1H2IMK6_9BACT|nr:hypothetical protein SAMN04487931_10923 [Desulfobacula phenolica]
MKKRIEFLFYPGMVALGITGPLDVFQAVNEIFSGSGRENEGDEMFFSALMPGPVPTSSGLRLHADNRPEKEVTNSFAEV